MIALLLLLTASARADVNMLEGSFRTTFIDAEIAGLKIERRYDSRSTYNGLFGFGWCSTFDTKLDLRTLKISDCGKPSNASTRYLNNTYVQNFSSGLTRIYSADTGELIALQNRKGPPVGIERPGLPRAAALGEGMKMRLEFDALRENIVSVTLPDRRLTFDYNDKHDLLAARNAWNNLYRFEYDSLHNLTLVHYPDGTEEHQEYDTDRDRLTKFQGRDQCIETYEHTISASANQRTQVSTATLKCDSRTKRTATFKFGFSRAQGRWQLNSFERGDK